MREKILSPEEYKRLCIKYNLKQAEAKPEVKQAALTYSAPPVVAETPVATPPAPQPVVRNRCGKCSRR